MILDVYKRQEQHPDHFILADCKGEMDFGEGKKSIYALPTAEILVQKMCIRDSFYALMYEAGGEEFFYDATHYAEGIWDTEAAQKMCIRDSPGCTPQTGTGRS